MSSKKVGLSLVAQVVALGIFVASASTAFADSYGCYIKVYKNQYGAFLDQDPPDPPPGQDPRCTVPNCYGQGGSGNCLWNASYNGTLYSYWCECSVSQGQCRLTFQSSVGITGYGIAQCIDKCPTGKGCPPGTVVVWTYIGPWNGGTYQAGPCPSCQ